VGTHDPQVFDPRIWVICGKKSLQVQVWVLSPKIPAGLGPGNPRVHPCSALALVQHQGRTIPKPVVELPLISGPNTNFFLSHPTWAKVFLPTLMHLFLISEFPFQNFMNNSPPFVAVIQTAFNVTHPNISFTVTARDTIVTMVCPSLWPCIPY
jgi:hypothetical protein